MDGSGRKTGQGTSDQFMDRLLMVMISPLCVENLDNSPAIVCNPRLDPEFISGSLIVLNNGKNRVADND